MNAACSFCIQRSFNSMVCEFRRLSKKLTRLSNAHKRNFQTISGFSLAIQTFSTGNAFWSKGQFWPAEGLLFQTFHLEIAFAHKNVNDAFWSSRMSWMQITLDILDHTTICIFECFYIFLIARMYRGLLTVLLLFIFAGLFSTFSKTFEFT